MKIHLARHYGMCFGVRDALRTTHAAAQRRPVTLLGQLVHNPEVDRHLDILGVHRGDLAQPSSAPTEAVIISAHGASQSAKAEWQQKGHDVLDTTCPLVRKAHDALDLLVHEGYHPVIIGQASHVEVRGLLGDRPEASVVLHENDVSSLPPHARFGVIAQTTQPLDRVLHLTDHIRRAHSQSEVRFIDTVCHPTKQRQDALGDLCHLCDTIVVVGGPNSNNTRQLAEKAARLGCRSHRVARPDELDPQWFLESENVGVTAGTSTLDETVDEVVVALRRIAASLRAANPVHDFLRQFTRAI